MRADRRAVQESSANIAAAIGRACEALRVGRVEHEQAFTDRMLAWVESELDGRYIKGLSWRAKTLTSQGPGSEEKRLGADFVGVLDIDLPEERVRKGFLAQAKRLDVGSTMPASEFERMRGQCNSMLTVTPAAYVFLYSVTGVRVVPAVSIAAVPAGQTANPNEFYSRSASSFFEAYLECFVGDRAVANEGDSMLDLAEILERVRARRALELAVALEGGG